MSNYTPTERVLHRLFGAAYSMTFDGNYEDAVVAATHAIVYWRKQKGDDISIEEFDDLTGLADAEHDVEPADMPNKTNQHIVLEKVTELQPTSVWELTNNCQLTKQQVSSVVKQLDDHQAITVADDTINVTGIGDEVLTIYNDQISKGRNQLPAGTWPDLLDEQGLTAERNLQHIFLEAVRDLQPTNTDEIAKHTGLSELQSTSLAKELAWRNAIDYSDSSSIELTIAGKEVLKIYEEQLANGRQRLPDGTWDRYMDS